MFPFGNLSQPISVNPSRQGINAEKSGKEATNHGPESELKVKFVFLADSDNAQKEENDDIRQGSHSFNAIFDCGKTFAGNVVECISFLRDATAN